MSLSEIERLELSLRGQDELIALASHDMRSALNAMVGWLHLLRYPRASEGVKERSITGLEAAVGTQCDLVERLLDGAKVVHGPEANLGGSVPVAEVLEKLGARYALRKLARNAITFSEVAPGAIWQVDGDLAEATLAALIAYCLTTVAAAQTLNVRVVEETGWITVVLEGSTMPAELHTLPHPRSSQSRIDEDPDIHPVGSGLTLTLAATFANLLGGTIGAFPAGANSSARWVSLRLPGRHELVPARLPTDAPAATEQPVPSVSSGSPTDASLRDVSVFLVDDRVDMREVTEAVLRKEGALVISCSSGADALERFSRWTHCPGRRLILSDLSMPDMDGIALIKQLRSMEQRVGVPRAPAVALSAHADGYKLLDITNAGFDLMLSKPIQPAQLARRIRRLLETI
ncbi:MAG: response regulator [Proteobacteria bacterium]|nr:response regulator [Burkholderiales bacterium]